MESVKRPRKLLFLHKRKSLKAIFSIFLGALSLTSGLLTVYFTYRNGGEAAIAYGAVILLSLIFAVTGMVLALLSRQEEDTMFLLSYLGMLLNGLSILLSCMVVYYGIL